MRTYLIQEEQNGTFARIQARTPQAALRKAAREFPRLRGDYNLGAEETCEVTWLAVDAHPADPWSAPVTATVPVPSRGAGRIRIGAVA